jgi:hypothetical protein
MKSDGVPYFLISHPILAISLSFILYVIFISLQLRTSRTTYCIIVAAPGLVILTAWVIWDYLNFWDFVAGSLVGAPTNIISPIAVASAVVWRLYELICKFPPKNISKLDVGMSTGMGILYLYDQIFISSL